MEVDKLRFERDQLKVKLRQVKAMDQIDHEFIQDAMLKDNPRLKELRESEDFYYERIQEVSKDLEKAKVAAVEMDLDQVRTIAQRHEFVDGVEGQQDLRTQLEN